MKLPVIEVALGTGLALVLWLGLQGFNVAPVFFIAALGFVLYESLGARSASRPAPAGPMRVAAVAFDDIGGQEMAKRELQEALEFALGGEQSRRLGIRPLKGLLLTGPPGTGKTLLAKAAATFTGAAFLSAAGSEFVEVFAGVGAQRVRDLFRKAREAARREKRRGTIVFIDEIDVLGGRRGSHASHLEYDQTLNQLLTEMDGIAGDEEVSILVIGATNRAEALDPALTRPGRFDRIVGVDLPDLPGRRRILELHSRNKPLAPDVDLEQVARETFGFSGAHLESLTNEAAILALRENDDRIQQRHLIEAVDKVILGEKLDRRPNDAEKHRVAVHEAGHAMVGEWVQPGSVSSVTITPRGRALGYVRSHEGEDRYLYTRAMLEDQIRVALAGAAAEELIFGQRSTGAASDFERALDLARRIVFTGLSDLGVVDADSVDKAGENGAVAQIISAQEQAVAAYLGEHRDALEHLAALLSEREALSGETVRSALQALSAAVAL